MTSEEIIKEEYSGIMSTWYEVKAGSLSTEQGAAMNKQIIIDTREKLRIARLEKLRKLYET